MKREADCAQHRYQFDCVPEPLLTSWENPTDISEVADGLPTAPHCLEALRVTLETSQDLKNEKTL